MTVNEVIKLLGYGTAYEIKGAYSGKIYHKSYLNSSKNLDKYANMEVTDEPFYADLRLRGSESNHWCIPVIVIWMHDYDLKRTLGHPELQKERELPKAPLDASQEESEE